MDPVEAFFVFFVYYCISHFKKTEHVCYMWCLYVERQTVRVRGAHVCTASPCVVYVCHSAQLYEAVLLYDYCMDKCVH